MVDHDFITTARYTQALRRVMDEYGQCTCCRDVLMFKVDRLLDEWLDSDPTWTSDAME